ncbi:MAG: hypothetical protein ABIK33_04245 [candidate division WOR-3 bacterium]
MVCDPHLTTTEYNNHWPIINDFYTKVKDNEDLAKTRPMCSFTNYAGYAWMVYAVVNKIKK